MHGSPVEGWSGREPTRSSACTSTVTNDRGNGPCPAPPQPPFSCRTRSSPITQTNNRFFDEVAKLMNDAAGVAGGVRREFDTMMRAQAERILRDLDVVQREEFEAVKEMARLAREENEALKARIAALEAKLGGQGS